MEVNKKLSNEEFKKLLVDNQEKFYKAVCYYEKTFSKRDDLFQEAFFKALKNYHTFKYDGEESSISGWISLVVRSTFINGIRRKQARASVVDKDISEFYSLEDKSLRVDSDYKEDWQIVEAMINELPEKARLSMRLKAVGYKWSEISELVEHNIGGLKSRWYKDKTEMQRKLNLLER